MKQTIVIAEIRNTKNPLIKQFMLSTVIEKPASANPVAFFLKGVPNVAPATEKRTYFQSISTDVLAGLVAQHKLSSMDDLVGKSFTDIFPQFKNARLAVQETFVQQTQGEWAQSPKINPNTGEVLSAGGRPIYRNVVLSLEGTDGDIYIQHDRVSAPVSKANPFETSAPSSIADLVAKGNVMETPVLP